MTDPPTIKEAKEKMAQLDASLDRVEVELLALIDARQLLAEVAP